MPTPVREREQLELELFADLFSEALDEPTPPTTAEEPEQSLTHVWIVAAEIKVEERVAKLADFRGSFTTVEGTRVDALEVYCRNCRRPYEDVADNDCEAEQYALRCLTALDAVSCLAWGPDNDEAFVTARGRRTLDRLMREDRP